MRVLNCLKGTVGFTASLYAVLNIFMYMFFILLAVIVVIFFCTRPANDTFFMCSSWGLPLSIKSAIECAPPCQDDEKPTKWMNKWLFTTETNLKINKVKED